MRAAVKAVLSGMVGIRRKAGHEGERINPLHLVIAGVALAALFVFTLVTIVRIVAG